MAYGILASGSCLLTDIVDQLHERSKKVNSVERLTRHLNKGVPGKAQKSYLYTIRKWVPDEPVVHIDDSDIVKPDGRKFESPGLVRDVHIKIQMRHHPIQASPAKNAHESRCQHFLKKIADFIELHIKSGIAVVFN